MIPAPRFSQLSPPPRLMCGPGPSNAHPRVYGAMAVPQTGHLDPAFLATCEETKELLRYVLQTKNEFTIPISGTGSAAWEACVANLIFAGDKCLTAVNGYFGERHCDMASRYGASVIRLERTWGEPFTLEEIRAAIELHKPQVFFIVHAETSTGVRQDVEGIAEICHANDCLFMLDTVTSIGGVPLFIDKWGVDAVYAGGQKCLSCPPGISLLSFSERAVAKMMSRSTKTPNWYLDMRAIQQYLVVKTGAPRVYHHTAPISMIYALRESLQLVAEEGLEARWKRHQEVTSYLYEGLEAMGLKCLVAKEHRLCSLTTVLVPEGIDWKAVITHVREKFNLEIGGGMGALAGKVWRVGIMGYNARYEVALAVLVSLKDALEAQGYAVKSSV